METTDLTLTILQHIRADIAKLGGRFGSLEGRFGTLEGRFDSLEGRFGTLEAEVAAMRKDVKSCLTRDEFRGAMIVTNTRFESLETRITEIDVRNRNSNQQLQDTLHQLMSNLGQHGSLAARIDVCERDIIDIKERAF